MYLAAPSKCKIMQENKMLNYLKQVLGNMPSSWLNLTTHRLDIYDEKKAKSQFLERFEALFNELNSAHSKLNELPTAFDYIRLGHPLSCILEWTVAKLNHLDPNNVISFSSRTIPVLAILRKNLLDNKNTKIYYIGELPKSFNIDILKNIYIYSFELIKIDNPDDVKPFNGSTILISEKDKIYNFKHIENIDFIINISSDLGSILLINSDQNKDYVSKIQHVRRRETIAMTPANSHFILNSLASNNPLNTKRTIDSSKSQVFAYINEITGTDSDPLVASSGLSIQYAILMGLIHDACENHKHKEIKIIVPPNCYGGTNDQARRIAECIENVEIVDLPVDGGKDMVESIDRVLDQIAKIDAIPYIIAEIPTNPRVEVPDLIKLKEVLIKKRFSKNGSNAVEPVFILDQTFCPNVHFLGEDKILSSTPAISYASGSKFPSGGLCTAGYCVANKKADALMSKIEMHLHLCDNEATNLQYKILEQQLPSMNQRIYKAYLNTREFVGFINEVLPSAKINFVSDDLAKNGFTPSVFSLDLPTKGNTEEEKENYKRKLNHKLITLMINEIPNESKYCVSYGQLKGCYWTIPATSTQGTTKEGDKDYIARVALSADMNLDLHKKVFTKFVEAIQ